MRRDFLEAGAGHFGSGWLWLVSRRDRLRITTTPDADLPLRYGDTPILCADLWEHAYYLDYRNERASYLKAFIDHLANWEFAAGRTGASGEQRPSPRLATIGGAPSKTRTCDLQVRNLTLYPTELWAREKHLGSRGSETYLNRAPVSTRGS